VVKRWADVASREDIEAAINLPGQLGTALCMAASLKRDHESGKWNLISEVLKSSSLMIISHFLSINFFS
jgi:E3 ubiquitin-protein ligase KEG